MCHPQCKLISRIYSLLNKPGFIKMTRINCNFGITVKRGQTWGNYLRRNLEKPGKTSAWSPSALHALTAPPLTARGPSAAFTCRLGLSCVTFLLWSPEEIEILSLGVSIIYYFWAQSQPQTWGNRSIISRPLPRPDKAGFINFREQETWGKGGLIFHQVINGH